MKHIKEYSGDDYTGVIYYLIPTDYRFEDSLEKTNMPRYFIDQYLNNLKFNFDMNKIKYIFINNYNYFGNSQWNWNKYKGIEKDKSFEDKGSVYGGRINIEDYELEANKYNI